MSQRPLRYILGVYALHVASAIGITGVWNSIEDDVISFHLILQKCGEHYNRIAPIVPESLWLLAMHTLTTNIVLIMLVSMIVRIKKLPVMSGCVDWSDEPKDFLCELKQHRKNNHSNLITWGLNILYYIRSDIPHQHRGRPGACNRQPRGLWTYYHGTDTRRNGSKHPEIKKALRFRERISMAMWRRDEWKL